MKHDPDKDRCDGGGNTLYDVGVTGLAVLAFLESGASVKRPEVHRALQWLRAQQDDEGALASRKWQPFMYGHSIATLALAKAYAQSRDARYLAQLRPALSFILNARSAGAGWRYQPAGDETDTSITCWAYRALAAGADAGLELDLAEAARGTRAYLDSVTDVNGVTGYIKGYGAVARPQGRERFEPDRSRAMTAAAVVLRLLLDGSMVDRPRILKSLDRCLERLPSWSPDDGSIDMYYWYYGTLAVQADRARGGKWRKALYQAVLKHQQGRSAGARAGSFDPVGVWGEDGGRVYATAILALALVHAD